MFYYKKEVSLTSVSFLIIWFSQAQVSLGFSLGLSKNFVQTNISTQSFSKLQSKKGYVFSINSIYRISRTFLIEVSPEVVQKNYSIEKTGIYRGIYDSHNNTYVQLPVTTSLEIINKSQFQFFLKAGMYVSKWVCAKEKGKIPDIFSVKESTLMGNQTIETFNLVSYSQTYSFNPQKDRRFEVGNVGGVAFAYKMNDNNHVYLSMLWFQSLSDQQKNYMIVETPRYNQTFTFMFGFVFDFTPHSNNN